MSAVSFTFHYLRINPLCGALSLYLFVVPGFVDLLVHFQQL